MQGGLGPLALYRQAYLGQQLCDGRALLGLEQVDELVRKPQWHDECGETTVPIVSYSECLPYCEYPAFGE